jgi:chemotaxis family two-component system sensor kinase Cph1
MQALVSDIMAYARAGTEELTLVRAPLTTALNWAKYGLSESINTSCAEIEAGPLVDAEIDVAQISVVFQNLLSNSIKFSKPGERPQIRVEGGRTQNGMSDEWLVSVRDQGIGFEAHFSQRIFGPFERLHPPGKYPGTGIGLSVCKRIIEAHGGRIWAEGNPGKGATFYFTVPAEGADISRAAGGGS